MKKKILPILLVTVLLITCLSGAVLAGAEKSSQETQWQISVLQYGVCKVANFSVLLPNSTVKEQVEFPFLGFLLKSGNRYVLVDTGVDEAFGKLAWSCKEGSLALVKKALKDNGVTPDMIEMVIYTHLHYDHAGGCQLFPKAVHVFQKSEWEGLLDPLPIQLSRSDYDPNQVNKMRDLKTLMVDGDAEILPGINVYEAGGHSVGGQLITVETAAGMKVLAGDVGLFWCAVFPDQVTSLTDLNGLKVAANPNLKYDRLGITNSLITDYFEWYDSSQLLHILAQNKWQNVYPGHEPGLLKK